ncbi:peptidoglycan editing factor PgeF [Rossellomorea aquimaris]|nr:peptidoglycan editing factor PgeF [Rossellomorea aquimaris]
MEPFHKEDESFYAIKGWNGRFPGLIAGISTRHGGVSEDSFDSMNMGLHVGDDQEKVRENRSLLSDSLGFPLERWVGAEQTHGHSIWEVTPPDMGKGSHSYATSIKDTDGLMTDNRDLLLTMCYADCVPLYLLDGQTGRIGVAHAGWKGTVEEIGPAMVKAFMKKGSLVKDIEVVIGPSICEKCYVVDDRVLDRVKKVLEDETDLPYNLKEEGQYHLDLKKVNKRLLLQSGLQETQIQTSGYCSSCSNDFFSYRRDQGKTGRMMSFIGLKE